MKSNQRIYPIMYGRTGENGGRYYMYCNRCATILITGIGNEHAESHGELLLSARVNDWYVKDNLYLCNNCNRWWRRWAIKIKEFLFSGVNLWIN